MAKRNKYQAPKVTELNYQRQLSRVARVVGSIIEPYVVGSEVPALPALLRALEAYAQSLTPWANRVASQMLSQVNAANRRAVRQQDKRFTSALSSVMAESQIGLTQQFLQQEQVTLIKSLPTEAGVRVQNLANEAVLTSSRGEEIEAELLRSGQVTESRARLIARTEVAKANSTLTEARATSVGSQAYIWRTAGDGAVRESHAEMEGEVVRWDTPPTLSDGTTTHAGQIYNCRCFAEPIFPSFD